MEIFFNYIVLHFQAILDTGATFVIAFLVLFLGGIILTAVMLGISRLVSLLL